MTATGDFQLPLLDKVRAHVLSGDYGPGDQIPEAVLASEFGVSRTPIREVFKQLESEGLVQIRPRVGTFVYEPTKREIIELFQLKSSLEGLAASLFASRAPERELSVLEANVSKSANAVDHGDSETYAKLVHEFHWTIVEGADNNKLYDMYELLMNQLVYHKLVLKTVSTRGRLIASNQEHERVLQAFVDKDPIAAEIAMREHVSASSRAALITSHGPSLSELKEED
ncbi:GntR family transcriptional regulator [uncultured Lawsonella sp.]|uniref:GntR family transcriptional regulator n=1 Tax=uncultured Lawsonella sp. TaxID=1847727 RepID=UPI0026363292|nr:GntR family transcriptional regulator [uncultured Lawsonella sp.]